MAERMMIIGGVGGKRTEINASMAVRHGMIAGATGTGKTITLQTLAENFSRMGVPVFMADVKGDLSGLAEAGVEHPKITERLAWMDVSGFRGAGCPTLFWDLEGKNGHPVRTTISEMGPLLLANALELTESQTGLLYTCFRVADDQGLLLLDLKDLRAMIKYVSDNARELGKEYGLISAVSAGAVARQLLILEEQGAEQFFGEPALAISDLMIKDFSGNGVINILDATKLISASPRLYSIFLLWLLSELYESLPEAGEVELPKLVFFFDEAHLLFDQAPKALLEKIEQLVRLIRSKGVGIFFVSQSPLDVPEDVLGQLGMKIQHALRAFTPKDRKTVKAVAQSFPENPDVDVEEAITGLAVGEALVSSLDRSGKPTPVQRIFIRPPESRMGPLDVKEKEEKISRSPLKGKYDTAIDAESAHEVLLKKAEEKAMAEEKAREELERQEEEQKAEKAASQPKGRGRQRQGAGEAFIKSAARSIGSQLGRSIVKAALGKSISRGLLGSILGGLGK
ncbi:MAG: DUF853 domain-containing protein [Nitrospinota bacterium]|nr:DUF853 domain-containing protein [Nitrospinota bacterium]